jgi:hypothetical protein
VTRFLIFLPTFRYMLAHLRTLAAAFLPSYTSINNPRYISMAANTEVATFASGCFWGTEHIFLKHYPPAQNKGILKTAVGYTGGRDDVKNPNYRQVCTGETGHAEACRVEFDPSVVKYEELVGTYMFTSCGRIRFSNEFYLQSSSTALTTPPL